MYVFWDCVAIQKFWLEVTECIEEFTTLNARPSVEVCLLGVVDALAPKRVTRTLLTLVFYYTKKMIILSWKKSTPPDTVEGTYQ